MANQSPLEAAVERIAERLCHDYGAHMDEARSIVQELVQNVVEICAKECDSLDHWKASSKSAATQVRYLLRR